MHEKVDEMPILNTQYALGQQSAGSLACTADRQIAAPGRTFVCARTFKLYSPAMTFSIPPISAAVSVKELQ